MRVARRSHNGVRLTPNLSLPAPAHSPALPKLDTTWQPVPPSTMRFHFRDRHSRFHSQTQFSSSRGVPARREALFSKVHFVLRTQRSCAQALLAPHGDR